MRLKRCFLILLVILNFSQIQASHIVGGEIQYKYLGSNRYLLTFKIYPDCSSQTKFDGETVPPMNSKFFYGIFEGNVDNNVFTEAIRGLTLKSKSKIMPVISHTCLTPNNTCVEEGVYETEVVLPRNDIGYTILHQRCCRNDDIVNIRQLPGGTNTMPGFTIKCYIPPTALFANNSAKFKKFPPIFICKDQPFYFDHSAEDADGDSLKYFLSTPLDGLSENIPLSANQSLSDNRKIEWETPYSMNDMLGGTPALTIDSITGFLSCRPNRNGRFVVSIIVVEYRNGTAIDTINRDFQFNVVDCDIPKADMPFQERSLDPNTGIGDYLYTFCDTFFVKFKNTSSNSSSYKWDFGDPSTGSNNFSTLFEPTHTYSDTGIFRVKLIAFKVRIVGDTCRDSTYRNVRVYPRFRVKFTGHSACPDSIISFTDLTTSNYGNTQKWNWAFGDGAFSILSNPKHSYSTGGTYTVRLIATDSKQCIDTATSSIIVHNRPSFMDSLPKFCIGQTKVIYNPTKIEMPDSIVSFRWNYLGRDSFGQQITHLMSSNVPIPLRLFVSTDKGCKFEKDYWLKVYPEPNPPVLLDSYFVRCDASLLCGIEDPYALKYRWHDGVKDSVRYLSEKGWYKLTITYPCVDHIDSFYMFKNELNAKFTYNSKCLSDTFLLENKSTSWLGSQLKYKWHLKNTIDTGLNFKYKFPNLDSNEVILVVYDVWGCTDTMKKSPIIYPIPKIELPFPKLCKDVPYSLRPKLFLPLPYTYSSFLWRLEGRTVSTDSIYLHTSTTIDSLQVSLAVITDKGCSDSMQQWIRTHPIPNPKVFDDSFFIRCADTLRIDLADDLAIRYTWRDNSVDSIRMIQSPGRYYFTVTYPCQIFSDSFKVHNSCTIEAPRAFTPNGDGINDLFYLRGYKEKKLLSLKIYNRQGQLVFHTQNINEGWDGYYKDIPQNSETYYYTYEAITHFNDARASGEGQFLLLR